MLAAAYFLKHYPSKEAFGDYLKNLKQAGAQTGNDELRTTHTFFKRYKPLQQKIQRITLCNQLLCNAVLVNGANGKPTKAQPCGHDFLFHKQYCYTLLLPVEEQLAFFLEHYGLKEPSHNQEDDQMLGGITTGECYKSYLKKLTNVLCALSLLLNTDGAQLFELSKFGFWPFMGLINEANQKISRSNVIIFALYSGDKKPPSKIFLEPVVKELIRLATTGFMFKGVKFSVHPLILSTDTIARPVLSFTIQFNGLCGCVFCYHPGIFDFMSQIRVSYLKNVCSYV